MATKIEAQKVSLRIKFLIRIFFPFVFVLSAAMAPLLQAPSKEYQLKAIFLFNFTQFIEWPANAFADANTPLVIGVLGENPFGTYLEETVSGEKINGHRLVVHHYKNVQEIKNCHILFVNLRSGDRPEQALSSLRNRNILTVSDAANFIRQGGMIRFFNENNRIRIQINQEAAKDADLTISSKLLRLAEITNN
jgi:hypothetical protein